MYRQDWLMRQIEMAVQAIARIIFKKDSIEYEQLEETGSADILYNRLLQLLEDRKVNEAENLLFAQMKSDDVNYLILAMDFYMRLNKWSDEMLEEADFTREEIQQGLADAEILFGVDL